MSQNADRKHNPDRKSAKHTEREYNTDGRHTIPTKGRHTDKAQQGHGVRPTPKAQNRRQGTKPTGRFNTDENYNENRQTNGEFRRRNTHDGVRPTPTAQKPTTGCKTDGKAQHRRKKSQRKSQDR